MLFLFFLTTLGFQLHGQQVVLATEDFDGGGIGYTTTSEFNSGTGNNHFNDTDGTDISNVSGPYSFEGGGNVFWAAENVDDPAGNGASEQWLVTNNFPISGYEGIEVCIDMAAGNNGLGNLGTYDQSDYVFVQYNTDIQPLYRDAISFRWSPNPFDPNDLFNQPLHHDVNRDGDGSDGVQITTTAQNFCYIIPNIHTIDVSATMMSIRLLVRMDANSEEIAFDNISVSGILAADTEPPTSTCNDPIAVNADFCPIGIGPGTPNGGWGNIPASGVISLQVGPVHQVDLNCLMDNVSPIGDLQIRLASAQYIGTPTSCNRVIESVYDIRDAAGNIAPSLVRVHYTLENNDPITQIPSPGITCGETFTMQSENDYIYIVEPPTVGSGTAYNCWSGIRFQTPTFETPCGDFTDFAIKFSAESTPPPIQLPTDQFFGGTSGNPVPSFPYVLPAPSIAFYGSATTCSATTRVTYELTDECGKVFTCFFLMEVEDSQDPQPNCNNISVSLPGSTPYTLTQADIDAIGAGTTDNCGIDPTSITVTPNTFTAADAGDNTVTYEVSDNCGNTATCSAIVSVVCELNVDCSNIIDQDLECRTDLPPVDFDLPIIVDSCGIVVQSALTIIPGNSGCPGDEVIIPRTYFIQDAAGNMEQCEQTFTIESTIPPTITCPINLTLACGQDTSPANTGMATGTASCGNFALNITFEDASTQTTTGCNQFDYTITRTWKATDDCGRETTCDQLITVQDNDAPVVSCSEITNTFSRCAGSIFPNTPSGSWFPVPSSGTFLTAVGGSSITTVDLNGCVVDNCSDFADMEWELVSSYEENRTSCSVDIINELGIRDACGNEAATTIIVRSTIVDDEAPVVTCADFTTTSTGCSSGLGANTPNGVWIPVGSDGGFTAASGGSFSIPVDLTSCVSDNCTDLADIEFTLHSSYEENRTSCQVTLVNEFSIRDACGTIAADRVITRITIVDDEAPSVTCSDFAATMTGCPAPLGPNTPTGSWFRVGTDGGFTAVSGGSFSIPVDLTTCLTDNCSDLADLELSLHSSYEENRTSCAVTLVNEFSVRDECGNVSADRVITRITIQDDEAPVVTCTEFSETFNRCPDSVFPNTPSGNWQNVPAGGIVLTAIGGSSIGTLDLNCISDNCSAIGELQIRLTRSFEENRVPGCSVDILNEYEARDACGNISPDLILFRGQLRFDGPPPVLTAPIAFPLECGMSADPSVTGIATATSGCGSPVVTYSDQSAAGPCGLSEIITRTWLATDGCGKTSDATQLIVITDNTPPVITTAPDVTVNCDDDTTPTGTGMPTATDACSAGLPTITFADDVRPGTCPGNYIIRRTWTATDECNNSDSYLQIVTVQDIEGPVFAQAVGTLNASFLNDAFDLTYGSGTCVTALDLTGLEAAINAALTAGATGSIGIVFPTPSDACSDPIVTTAVAVLNVRSSACRAVIDVTYTSTDACGNSSDYLQQIEVNDRLAPTISIPVADLIVECDMPTDVAATGTPTFVDECPAAIVAVTHADVEVADPTCPNGKTITRTFTAEDPCGNTSSVVQIITVVDTEAPVYTSFPRDTTVECSTLAGMRNNATNAKSVADAQGFPAVEDNCSTGLSAPFTDVFTLSTNCPTVGIYERIFAPIDDGCGNILPARTLTITIIDTLAPVFTSIPLGGDFDCTVGIPPVGTATAVDCDPNVVVTEVDDETIVGVNQVVSITERTITARDFCGNETTQVETYRVLDQVGPFLLSCPDNLGPIVARPDDRAQVNFASPVFDDNCSFSVSGTHVSGQDFPVGITQVVFTAVDGGGNITICEFEIEVVKALNLTCLDQNISIDAPADLTRSDINFPYAATDCSACPQGESLPSLDYLGYFRGHRYYVSAPGDTRSWTEAQRHAVSLGGRLVEVNSAEENLFLQRELPYDQALIGHYTGPRSSTWTGTFSPVIFENWALGFPITGTNEFFAMLQSADGTHTNANHSEQPYIIEFPCVEIEVIDMPSDSLFDRGTHCIVYAAEDLCGNRDTCHYTFGVNTFDVVYCAPTGDNITQEEDYFITNVSIGAFAKTLDASDLYIQTRDTVELDEDIATNISLSAETSGMEGASFPAYWRVWVDANGDGDFYEAGEMIYEAWGDATHTGSIMLPSSLSTVNPARIRVAFSRFAYPEPCGDNPFGAVVDFSLKSNSTVAPRLALRGMRGQGMHTLTTTSVEDPQVDMYMMLRGASADDLTKIDFWQATFGNNELREYETEDLDPMPSAYYQAVALDDRGFIIRSSNVIQLTMPTRRDPVKVFPNPAVHEVYVDFGHIDEDTSIEPKDGKGEIILFDPLGRMIQTQAFELGVKRIRVQLPDLVSGFYTLRVTRPNKQAKNVRIMIDQSAEIRTPRA